MAVTTVEFESVEGAACYDIRIRKDGTVSVTPLMECGCIAGECDC